MLHLDIRVRRCAVRVVALFLNQPVLYRTYQYYAVRFDVWLFVLPLRGVAPQYRNISRCTISVVAVFLPRQQVLRRNMRMPRCTLFMSWLFVTPPTDAALFLFYLKALKVLFLVNFVFMNGKRFGNHGM